MVGAFDHTFKAPVPGMSIAHHKLGELPHEKPPEYTDPDEALHYFWTMLTRVDIQRQLWSLLKLPGATVWAVARAMLFKAAMQGIIQMNLGVVIYPTVLQMVSVIGKAGGVNATMFPEIKSKQKEAYIKQNLKALIAKYDKDGLLTGTPAQQAPAQTPPPIPGQQPTNSPASPGIDQSAPQNQPDQSSQDQSQGQPPAQPQASPSQGSGLLSGMANNQPGGQQ